MDKEEGKVIEMEVEGQDPQMNAKEDIGSEAASVETPLEKMIRAQAQFHEQMEAIAKELDAEGFSGHTYGEGSVIQMPGPKFAEYSNFLSGIMKNLSTVQHMLNTTFQLCEGVITTCTEYQVEFMNMHLANCRAGITATNEQMNREDAEKELVKVEEDGVKIEVKK